MKQPIQKLDVLARMLKMITEIRIFDGWICDVSHTAIGSDVRPIVAKRWSDDHNMSSHSMRIVLYKSFNSSLPVLVPTIS